MAWREEVARTKQAKRKRNDQDAFALPDPSLLDTVVKDGNGHSSEKLKATARLLEKTLADYGVQGTVQEIHPGPTVTMFEVFHPAPCLAYRIEHGGKVFVFCTDHELLRGDDESDPRQVESRAAEQRLEEEGIRGQVFLFKNNTDSAGNSYGCHENYLVDRDVDFYYLAEQLIPFLVTRQIYTGAGKVFQTQDGVHYCISQRAQHIYQKISGTTTNDRSIINTRDEPHADAERFRRLHVIVGDSNMSEYTAHLKVAT